jgi:hypothetical protein
MAASAVTAKECLQSAEACLALAHKTMELGTRAAAPLNLHTSSAPWPSVWSVTSAIVTLRRWPARLVATAEENRLNIRAHPHTSFAKGPVPPGVVPSSPTNKSPALGAGGAWSKGEFQRTERVSLVRPFYDRLMAVRSRAERRVKLEPRGALTSAHFFELDLVKK